LLGDPTLGTVVTLYDTVYNTNMLKISPLHDTTICAGDPYFIKLKAKFSGGTPPYSVFWLDMQLNSIISTTDSVSVLPTSSTSYVFVVNDSSSCSQSAVSHIMVNPLPIHNAAVFATVCLGSNYIFDAGNNNGNLKNYLWNTGDTTRTVTRNSQSASTVKITDTLGCSTTNSFYLNISALPTIHAGNDTTICKGKSIFLYASGGVFYQWYALPNSTIIGNNSFLNVYPDSSTTYRILGIDTLKGLNCSQSDTVNVFVNPKPSLPSISGPSALHVNEPGIYTVANHSNSAYNWSIDNGSISSGQGSYSVNALFGTAGTEKISVTETNLNCISDTSIKNVTVNVVGGIENNNPFDQFNMYPNPTTGLLNIEFETSEKNIAIEVFDVIGKSVLKNNVQHTTGMFRQTINMASLVHGIYFVKVSAGEKNTTVKVAVR